MSRQTLLIFSGLPGVGKTTLANKLARELHWPLLKIDDVIGQVPENPAIEFWDSKVDVLLDVLNTQLELGLSVIADSVFMNMDRQHAQELARKYKVRFLPVYIFLSDENLWKERVTKRFNELHDEDVATWERIQHQREHFAEWQKDTALFVDSMEPMEKNFERILEFVQSDISLKPLQSVQLSQGRYHR